MQKNSTTAQAPTPQLYSADKCIEDARRVVRIEAAAVAALESRIGATFTAVVDLLYNCTGRVVVTGIGKSGIIGKKIAATLSSTGTPAFFLHATEGLHGDLGMLRSEDVVICISKSGSNSEFDFLVPQFRRLGVTIVAFAGNLKSNLAQNSDFVIDISVEEEACPLDLAPTASSTATLAMGDALAIAVLGKRQFSVEDFAARHPGGALGRRLFLRADDLVDKTRIPMVVPDASFDHVLAEISKKRYGATCVIGDGGKIIGFITDGDLRRILRKNSDHLSIQARDIMTSTPRTIAPGTMAVKALEIMEEFSITHLVIVDDKQIPQGLVHIHDLIKAGIS
ncbi:MAG: KpsF/GutQ family sugar-phosphate isomerase [Calditrichaeota bacterium]|nr:MAG: KpsF/GutQ family sugar-phosphate isomerase [Calditrichota bacterium]